MLPSGLPLLVPPAVKGPCNEISLPLPEVSMVIAPAVVVIAAPLLS